jgi:hypothetical protein
MAYSRSKEVNLSGDHTCELSGSIDSNEGVFQRVEPCMEIPNEAIVEINEVSSLIKDSI